MEYAELRWHSHLSIGLACGSPEDHVNRAAELGMTTCCLTETNSMRSVYELHKACADTDVRPVYGVEFLVCDDHLLRMTEEDKAMAIEGCTNAAQRKKAIRAAEVKLGYRKVRRLCLRALTSEGLLNLFRLTSAGWTEGFIGPGRPRIDLDLVARYSEGVSCSVGGVDGLVVADLLAGDAPKAFDDLEALLEIFDRNLWLELQPHAGPHRKANLALLRIGQHFDIDPIAVNDVLYLDEDDTAMHEVALCISRRGMTLDNPDHPRSPKGRYLRDAEDMLEAFGVNHSGLDESVVCGAIERTVAVAELHQAELNVDKFRALVPKLHAKPDKALRELCESNLESQGFTDDVYRDRLARELGVIKDKRTAPYFHVVHDLIEWARGQGILVGPGRGSAAGSFICKLLRITALDPIEHNLLFERFISEDRIDLPDIDIDFEDHRREDVISYVEEKYGTERTSHIATVTKLSWKSVVKDVGRVLGIDFPILNRVTNVLEKAGDDFTLDDAFQAYQVCRTFDEDYPEVLPLAKALVGHAKQIGIHASGFVASSLPLPDVLPIEIHKGKPITAVDMKAVDALGVVKLDLLGLRTLSELHSAAKACGIGIEGLEALPLNDKPTLKAFAALDFSGVFQHDGSSARDCCDGLPFRGFDTITAGVALNRPGPMQSGLTEKYKARAKQPGKVKPFHPVVDEVCKDTYGCIVYQEQVSRIFVELGTYTAGEADAIRKVVSKKEDSSAIEDERERFVASAVALELDENEANKMIDQLKLFAGYAFNKSHAAAYALIAYWCQYLKVHHPVEFFWAMLHHEPNQEVVSRFAGECTLRGIDVLPPDVNVSGSSWAIDGEAIRASLLDLKGVGPVAVAAIEEHQPFEDITDLMVRVPGRAVHSGHLTTMVKAGALRALLPNTRWSLEHTNLWLEPGRKKKSGWVDQVLLDVEASRKAPDFDEQDLLALSLEVAPPAGRNRLEIYQPLLDGPLAHVKWTALGSKEYWKVGHGFFCGTVSRCVFSTVTAKYDDGRPRPDAGKRVALIDMEGMDGSRRTMKCDHLVTERFADVLAQCPGTSVAVFAQPQARYSSTWCLYMADLESLRQKLRLQIALSPWERCFLDPHPVAQYSSKSLERKSRSQRFRGIGLVTYVKKLWNKDGEEYAFVGVQDAHRWGMMLPVWAEDWSSHRGYFKPGEILHLAFRRGRQGFLLDEEGVLRRVGSIESPMVEAVA